MVDKVEELRGCLWNKIFGADYAKMDELISSLISAVEERERERVQLPVIYGIFRKGYGETLLSKIEDRADSGHCDLHYGGLIEEGKRYGLILLPEKGKYVVAPILKEKKP